jgi:hypothetical protein
MMVHLKSETGETFPPKIGCPYRASLPGQDQGATLAVVLACGHPVTQ